MKYKVIALDLDGTLLDSKKKVSDKNREALDKARKQGAIVCLASGRPVYGIRNVSDALCMEEKGGYILAFNGGKVIDCRTQEVIWDVKIPDELVPQIYDFAVKHQVNLVTYRDNDMLTFSADNEFARFEAMINGLNVVEEKNMLDVIDFPVNKFLITEAPGVVEVLEKEMRQCFPQLSIYRSEPFFLEIVPQNIEKSYALSKIAQKEGITAEQFISFGDGYNDISMIEYAGMGIAMANANEECKKRADDVTLSNDEDGVAYALEKYL